MLDGLMSAAEEFWKQRGVNIPGDVALDVADGVGADDAEHAVGRGMSMARDGSNRVVMDSHALGGMLASARNGRRSVGARRRALSKLGGLLAHELGHVADLPHTANEGVMDPGLALRSQIPWGIRLKARELIPRDR